ncbi:tigger transposable element-derived protein 6 [Plakobranchus ocellatus]|uniref:Tigger transposable element-derived protein 6 n=1 Tax=Plakobranchus ocellatus TaxID=259542 RepID=A0AAV3Z1Q1_9GAST|nr:tigger transposable element-derived protein 6 [Plakobranchus ocellatus]
MSQKRAKAKYGRKFTLTKINHVLTSQAEFIAQELGMKDFTASVEWIERFKHRHGIALRTASGEAAAVDCTVTNAWKEHDLPSLPSLTYSTLTKLAAFTSALLTRRSL